MLCSVVANPYQSRIKNGYYAAEGQFPYQVYLSLLNTTGGYNHCGGSIIDNEWVLTAAHCTENLKSVTVKYGSINRNAEQFSHKVQPENVFSHPQYDDKFFENDIALIRTPHVEFSERVQKVALADRDKEYANAWGIASGWGRTENGRTEFLKFVEQQILPQDKCFEEFGYKTRTILCVNTADGKSPYFGDSGGPLVTIDDHKLVGVCSSGTGQVGIFNKVSYQRDWIRDISGIP